MKLENFTKYICHRKPERSFFYKGHQFPVCARCTGFYISGILTIILLKIYPIDFNYYNYLNNFNLNFNLSFNLNFYNFDYFSLMIIVMMYIVLLIPAFIDGTTQLLKKRESNNTLRLITGLLGGVGLILIYRLIIFEIFKII